MIKIDGTITVGARNGRRELMLSGQVKPTKTVETGSAARHDPIFVSVNHATPGTPEVVTKTVPAPRSTYKRPAAVPKSGMATETAAGPGGPGGTNYSGTANGNMESTMLNPLLGEFFSDLQVNGPTNTTLDRVYNDIYYNDATCGSAVDLLQSLPFSEFSLTGLRDEKALRPFMESCENINIIKLLSEATVQHFVSGRHVGALSWDDAKKTYSGYVAFSSDNVSIQNVLNYGEDPVVTVNVPPSMKEALESDDDAFRIPRERLDPDLIRRLKEGDAVLNENELMYIPRRARIEDFHGVSWFRRVLPIWFYEKALIRGTLDQAHKSQKGIRHITAGQGEEWIPTSDEMTAIANLFLKAQTDPLSSIVVTREGINVNEVGSPETFWRSDQQFDQFSTMKLRALGMNESFITGEANYNTMEATLSVFVEWIRNFRQNMTQEFFYDKMFPRLAYANNLLARRYAKEVAGWSVGNSGVYAENGRLFGVVDGTHSMARELGASGFDLSAIDMSKYAIPKVHWHKRLMPEADSAYLDVLTTLRDAGLKIPLRVWAAAGGLDINSLLEDKAEDIVFNDQFTEWRKATKVYDPATDMGGGDGGGGMEFSSVDGNIVARPINLAKRLKSQSNVDTDPELGEFTDYDSRGHRRVMTARGRSVIEERFNKNLAAALVKQAEKSNHQARLDYAAYVEER